MSEDVSRAAEKEMASRILSRRRFLPFVQRINPRYTAGWVHEDIAERLEKFSDDVAKGLSPRLMILMPPRAGKSELASKTFPAWHLGRHPDHEFIACSYNLDLAMDFSKKIKAVLDSDAYQQVFDARLDPDNRSSASWGIHKNIGGYVAAGIGGGINGKGAHVLVIDDPIKNAEEADSAGIRESIWNWYGSVAYTRLAPGGGVLVIQCMTGDTPVLMSDGTEEMLGTLTVGDTVATFCRGHIAVSRISGIRSNGRDFVSRITTKRGKIVRANDRHPFLVVHDGELKWVRTKNLTTAHRIVTLKGSEENGPALYAQLKDAQSQLAAGGSAPHTTTSRSGLTDIAHQASTQPRAAKPTLNTATGSLPPTLMPFSKVKEVCALYVKNLLNLVNLITGRISSPLTTATIPVKSEDYSVTTAMQESDTLELSPWHLPLPNTSDFTLDDIVSIEPAGVEEVFDLQIEGTENFIADGLVSHNTWWHDDDLAGRLQEAMKSGDEDVSQFEIVKYPAIAEFDEYIDEDSRQIVRLSPETEPEEGNNLRLLRRKDEALHPERFPIKALRGIRATLPKRFWSALYQQNPVPDDGIFFTKDMFKRGMLPDLRHCNVSIAWDFAIGVKAKNDFTVGTVVLQDHNDVAHVAETLRFKSNDVDFIVNSILSLAKRWYHPSLVIGFEDGHIYKTLQSTLQKAMKKERFYPTTIALPPLTDKEVRATPLKGRMQQGMVSFNLAGSWYDNTEMEMLRFPSGIHDDCVDSLAWAMQMVIGRQPPKLPQEKATKSWKDRLNSTTRSTSHMAA